VKLNVVADDDAVMEVVVGVEDWSSLKEERAHLTNQVVDAYLELLHTHRKLDSGVVVLNSSYWSVLHTVDYNRFQAVLLPAFKKKHEKQTTRILWAVHGFGHFAVVDILVKERRIDVYDSIKNCSTKWVPHSNCRLQQLLCHVFPGKNGKGATFAVKYPNCRQQVNSDDCGVYAMANVRSLLFKRDINGTGMPGSHLGKKRQAAVMALRKKFLAEFSRKKLSKWW
jgi:Ulp1 family protease